MMSDTVRKMRQMQAPQRRQITKRQIPRLRDSGILSTKDANRSIEARREKDAEKEKKRLDKQWRKLYDQPPPQPRTIIDSVLPDSAVAAQQENQMFWIDTEGERR